MKSNKQVEFEKKLAERRKHREQGTYKQYMKDKLKERRRDSKV